MEKMSILTYRQDCFVRVSTLGLYASSTCAKLLEPKVLNCVLESKMKTRNWLLYQLEKPVSAMEFFFFLRTCVARAEN